ncbi:MAG: flippase-like domain-containing protein [Cyclobacteriaceae bacterium]|nr:flippase-like domain-containing protein [Cyclobacteriaceae bacterium HetDA_MAG_MS6]
MPQLLKKVIGFTLPVVFAIMLLYYAFAKVSFQEMLTKAGSVDYFWVGFSIFLSLIAYVLRAYRWNVLIEPLATPPSLFTTSLAVLVGYLANLAFPRLGEVTRCGILKRTNNINLSIAFGTVITERILDFVMLLLLLLVSMVLEFDILIALFKEVTVYLNLDIKKLLVLAALGVIALLSVFFLLRSRIQSFVKVRTFINELIQGVISLRKIRRTKGFVISTLGIWLIYYLMSYTIVFSMPETAGLPAISGLLLVVGGGIALSLPVQAGFGSYHALISGLLLLYGVEKVTGLFLATLLHTSQVIAVALFGGVSVLLVLLTTQRQREANKTEDSH